MSTVIDIDALMIHLRDKHKIEINETSHKLKLKNLGYYHGYKGYRYIGQPQHKIPFSNFDEVIAINRFDLDLKSLFYPLMMFIETALKNSVLEETLLAANSFSFEDIYKTHLTAYKYFPIGSRDYKEGMKKKLNLRNQFYGVLSRDYSNDKRTVQHFYHGEKTMPIWAIFQSISMGEFGAFVSCLDLDIKLKISQSIGFNRSCDSDRKLTERIIFVLKDLRNAIAHNDVIFDTRFKRSKIKSSVTQCIELDTTIAKVSFDTIVDYFILLIYLLNKLHVSNEELILIIKDFETLINTFRTKIPISVYSQIFYTDTRTKLSQLKQFCI